jgi:hypothetical protein
MARFQLWACAILLGARVACVLPEGGFALRVAAFVATVIVALAGLNAAIVWLKRAAETSPEAINARYRSFEIERRLSSLTPLEAVSVVRRLVDQGNIVRTDKRLGEDVDRQATGTLQDCFDEYGEVSFVFGDARIGALQASQSDQSDRRLIGRGVDGIELLAADDGSIWERESTQVEIKVARSIWHWIIREAAQIHGVEAVFPSTTLQKG